MSDLWVSDTTRKVDGNVIDRLKEQIIVWTGVQTIEIYERIHAVSYLLIYALTC